MRRLFIATTLFAAATACGRFVAIEVSNGIRSPGGGCLLYLTFFAGIGAFVAGVGTIVEAQPRNLIRPLAIFAVFGLGVLLLTFIGNPIIGVWTALAVPFLLLAGVGTFTDDIGVWVRRGIAVDVVLIWLALLWRMI
jgi:hypothetical protein